MAKASEHFRQSDVTFWGIATLVCASLAVFGSNIAMLVPLSVLGGLHQPRVAGASIETLRLQVTNLNNETVRLKQENEALLARFALQEKSGGEITRRVGALEVSVPRLLEDRPQSTRVDMASQTASVDSGDTLSFDAEGGSVAVRQSALPQATTPQPLPEPLQTAATPTPTTYGLAVGAPLDADQAQQRWTDLSVKLGPLLFGLSPLLAGETANEQQIIVGPVSELSEANALCRRFERVSIACAPVPYQGTPLGISP